MLSKWRDEYIRKDHTHFCKHRVGWLVQRIRWGADAYEHRQIMQDDGMEWDGMSWVGLGDDDDHHNHSAGPAVQPFVL